MSHPAVWDAQTGRFGPLEPPPAKPELTCGQFARLIVEGPVFVNLAAPFRGLSSKGRICGEYIDSSSVFRGEAGAFEGITPSIETGGPIGTFAFRRSRYVCECSNQRTTGRINQGSGALDLTFASRGRGLQGCERQIRSTAGDISDP
jgi:hypothetical protein